MNAVYPECNSSGFHLHVFQDGLKHCVYRGSVTPEQAFQSHLASSAGDRFKVDITSDQNFITMI